MERVKSVATHLTHHTADAAQVAAAAAFNATHKLYIGCYSEQQWWVSGSPGEGIYCFDFDATSGRLVLTQVETSIVSPSWSVVDPVASRFLLCVTEKGPEDPVEEGRICSFAISPSDGSLALISSQPTQGRGSNCVNICGGVAVCTNFFDGSLSSFVVAPDGQLGPPLLTHHLTRAAAGVVPDRQTQAHPHDVFAENGAHIVCVPDLGLDRLMCYAVDGTTGALSALPDSTDELQAGDGPRSLVQHPVRVITVPQLSSRRRGAGWSVH
jgi:6-phosphogluconolactonase